MVTRVLAVDDQDINLEILQEFLSDDEFDVVTATSGDQTLEKLRTQSADEQIDLVLLDWMMPGMDGIQVLKELKQDPTLCHLPVIMQTAKVDHDDLIEGLQAGAYYYLTKPLDESMLLSVVRRAASEHKQFRSFETMVHQYERISQMFASGTFKLQSIADARGLASFLSGFFPNSQRAISGLVELLLNAVEHGNLGVMYQEKSRLLKEDRWDDEIERRLRLAENRGKYVTVYLDQAEDRIEVTITDEGEGFDWQEFMVFNPARILDKFGTHSECFLNEL